MSATSRSGYASLVLGGVVALGVWILHQAGWLAAIDGAFYDRMLAGTVRWRAPVPQMLIVRVEHEDDLSAEGLSRLLGLLETGAREIVFGFIPRQGTPKFFEEAAARGNVVFGRELRRDKENPEVLRLAPLPPGADNLNFPWGIVHLSSPTLGVYRWQQAYVLGGTNTLPTLEKRLARLRDPVAASRLSAPFLVSFAGPPGRMPNVELPRVLAGDLIPEMVKGKTVLVGLQSGLVGLDTPVCRGAETMSLLEYQANSLQTVLDGTALHPLSGTASLLLLILAGAPSLFFYHRSGMAKSARLAVGFVLVAVLISAAMLMLVQLWLPLGAILVEQGALFALTLGFKTRAAYLVLQNTRLQLLREVRERACPEPVFSAGFWGHIASLVRQTLDVDRMLFLEVVPQTTRLNSAAAYDCSLDQLQQELSLQAPAFAQALASQGPLAISGLLKGKEAREAQYVCPLNCDGELVGIWVFGLDMKKVQQASDFTKLATQLSGQIACLVREKNQVAPGVSWLARLKSWLSREEQNERIQELRYAVDLLQQHHDVLDGLLTRIAAAILVYDRFGRPLYVNTPASTLLRAESFAVDRATASDLLRLLARQSDADVRDILRRVNLDGAPAAMPVRLASQEDRQYLLRLYPLTVPAARCSSVSGFTGGLVCELIDTTVFSDLASLKGVVAERLGVELRDHLAAVEVSATLLESDDLAPDDRRSVLAAVHQKIASCIYVITECEKYLGRHVDAHAVECYPLNALELLEQVCAQLTEKANERRVSFSTDLPQLMGHVLASKAELTQLLFTALSLLINDAAENTSIRIEVENSAEVSIFRFSNSGFGIPDERLQHIITGPEPPASKDFQVIRESLQWARNWNGSLQLNSGVGTGYRVVLKLRQFQLSSSPAPKA
jgi:signal transduction histidine kinase